MNPRSALLFFCTLASSLAPQTGISQNIACILAEQCYWAKLDFEGMDSDESDKNLAGNARYFRVGHWDIVGWALARQTSGMTNLSIPAVNWQRAVSLPDWKRALSHRAMPPAEREAWGREIVTFLRFCKVARTPATLASGKA